MTLGVLACGVALAIGQVDLNDPEKVLLRVGLRADIKSDTPHLTVSNLLGEPVMWGMYSSNRDNWRISKIEGGAVRVQVLNPGWYNDYFLSVDPKTGSLGFAKEPTDANCDWKMNAPKDKPFEGLTFQTLVQSEFNKHYLSVDEPKGYVILSEKNQTRWNALTIFFGLGGFDVKDPEKLSK